MGFFGSSTRGAADFATAGAAAVFATSGLGENLAAAGAVLANSGVTAAAAFATGAAGLSASTLATGALATGAFVVAAFAITGFAAALLTEPLLTETLAITLEGAAFVPDGLVADFGALRLTGFETGVLETGILEPAALGATFAVLWGIALLFLEDATVLPALWVSLVDARARPFVALRRAAAAFFDAFEDFEANVFENDDFEDDSFKDLEPLFLRVFWATTNRAEPPRPCLMIFGSYWRPHRPSPAPVYGIVPIIAHFPQKSTI